MKALHRCWCTTAVILSAQHHEQDRSQTCQQTCSRVKPLIIRRCISAVTTGKIWWASMPKTYTHTPAIGCVPHPSHRSACPHAAALLCTHAPAQHSQGVDVGGKSSETWVSHCALMHLHDTAMG
eukprot:1158222-Pelagomonas_calceolata.AAC.1